jgi:DNA-binding response OmpR family regulator
VEHALTPVRYDLKNNEVVFPGRRMHADTGPAWLLLQLASARGRSVKSSELVWRRWGGANEPDYARHMMPQWAARARRLLRGTGLTIGNRWGFGYYLVRQ